ncbi:MAG: hypothetical protein QOI75_6906 [Pseudonocardiales bacterium]|jgi:hypothetical protein|nr:hypothetical protein [Pseudonocardiales bacterium]
MLVVVALVNGVPLLVMQVIDMVAVWHRGVSAAVLVLVLVFVTVDRRVLGDLALGPHTLLLTVHMAVVGVVDVVTVLERNVSAAVSVLVAVVGVGLLSGSHRLLRNAGASLA